MEDNFDKLIKKLSKSQPTLDNPKRITNDILSKIKVEGTKEKKQSFIRLFAKVAAVTIFVLSSGLLGMQEWQATNNNLTMKEVQNEEQKHLQASKEIIDCKQLIKSSLRSVLPDVRIRVDKSNRVVEFDGRKERIALLATYLDSDLNRSNDGKFYLTENDIKAFGITCELF